MKKFIEFSAVLAIVFFAVSACSKNPVGPAMPSMSISAASTSTTAATASVTSGNGSGGTLNMTLDASGSSSWGTLTVSAGSSPRLSWTVSGVTGISKYEVWVYSTISYATVWNISYTNTSVTSVVYGSAPSGATVVSGPTALSAGSYNVIIHARNASSNPVGYANGTIIVK